MTKVFTAEEGMIMTRPMLISAMTMRFLLLTQRYH